MDTLHARNMRNTCANSSQGVAASARPVPRHVFLRCVLMHCCLTVGFVLLRKCRSLAYLFIYPMPMVGWVSLVFGLASLLSGCLEPKLDMLACGGCTGACTGCGRCCRPGCAVDMLQPGCAVELGNRWPACMFVALLEAGYGCQAGVAGVHLLSLHDWPACLLNLRCQYRLTGGLGRWQDAVLRTGRRRCLLPV